MTDQNKELVKETAGSELRLGRRTVLKAGVATGLMLGAASFMKFSETAAAATQEPKRGGTLRLAYTSGTVRETLDPARLREGNESMYCANIYDRLLRIENDFSVSAELAEKWNANADGSAWTFVLRDGLKFSDGTPLTSEDVAYSFSRLLDAATKSPSFAGLSQMLDTSGIEVRDARTIAFKLKSANTVFPQQIATRNFAVVKKGTTEFKVETAIGSGPFKIASFAPGESWELVRNPNYWRAGLPYLDGIRQVKIDEPATLVQSLLSGQSDVIGQVGPAQVRQVDGSPGARIVSSPNSGFMYVVMDMTQAPFDDPKVVKAVKAAVDRQALLNIVFQGHGTLTSDVNVWPGHPSYPPGLGVRAQNIEEAKRLLAEAGHPNGIDLQLYTSPSLSGMVEMATAFAEIVRPAGIRVAIQQENSGTYWSQVWQTKPMYISYSGARPPVATIGNLYVTKPAYAETKISNPEIDKLLAEVCASLDENKQNELLQQAWSIVADQAGASISFALNQLWGMRKTVQGVKPHSEDNLQFHEAHIA